MDCSKPLRRSPRIRKLENRFTKISTLSAKKNVDRSTHPIFFEKKKRKAKSLFKEAYKTGKPAKKRIGTTKTKRQKAAKKEKLCPSTFVGNSDIFSLNEDSLAVSLMHLRNDPLLSSVISQTENAESSLVKRYCNLSSSDPFCSLCRSLISQQLSGKAADSIFSRFKLLCGVDESCITPKRVLVFDEEQLRSCGFSKRKADYVKSLASFFLENKLDRNKLETLTDNEVKGIGEWTIHMFLMFSLGRPDILPVGDLIIRKSFKKIYQCEIKGPALPEPHEFLQISEQWRPYRSVASWFLWQANRMK